MSKGIQSREGVCRSDLHHKSDWYIGFMDLERVYDRVNRETLWQVLRMYDVVGKLLSEIKGMHVDSLACIRVKWG